MQWSRVRVPPGSPFQPLVCITHADAVSLLRDHVEMAQAQYSAMVLGATGNVGARIVHLLTRSPLCKKVVIVTRRKTGSFTDPKVVEVVVDLDCLEEMVLPHVRGVDIALAAFGIGKGSAKMPVDEVRKIEVTYPQAFCRAARAAGVRVCGVMTAIGANPNSSISYVRVIGEKEEAVTAVPFDFLGLYRPATILGNSNTPGYLGALLPLVHWAFPSKYHSIHKNDLARAMVSQSEEAFQSMSHGSTSPSPMVKILEYQDMQRFFVQGESTEPELGKE